MSPTDPTWPWRWFTRAEVTCHCGCGDDEMDPGTMARADLLRDMCGFALPVTSGKRCEAHNRAVGGRQVYVTGVWRARHDGHALDIHIVGLQVYILIEKAMAVGFTGIGIKQKGPWRERFVHIDDLLPAERRAIWTY